MANTSGDYSKQIIELIFIIKLTDIDLSHNQLTDDSLSCLENLKNLTVGT